MKKCIFVIGTPLAGKTSLCRELGKHKRFRHIAVGELIRRNAKYADEIRKHLVLGELIPDIMCFEILREELASYENDDVIYLIDGFPRSRNSMLIWKENSMPIPIFVVYLRTNMATLLARRTARAESEGRCDDDLSIFKLRMDSFVRETIPVITDFGATVIHFKSDGCLNNICREVLATSIQLQ